MLFEKVVNPNVDLVKRDVVHLFSESDFPRSSQKIMFYEACNCYISIECIDDIEEFTDDKDTINRLKNKNVYFVEFSATVEELGDKKGSLVLEDIYENFIDNMEGSIKYLNDYLIKEDILNRKRRDVNQITVEDVIKLLEFRLKKVQVLIKILNTDPNKTNELSKYMTIENTLKDILTEIVSIKYNLEYNYVLY